MRRVVRAAIAGAVAFCGVVPVSALGQAWSVQRNVGTSLESNNNYALVATPGGRVNTLSLSGALNAARATESSATNLDVGLSAFKVGGAAGQDRLDGRLSLSQSLSAARDSVNLSVNAGQDQTFDTTRSSSADVALGRGRRRSRGASASGSHSLSERLSASLQASTSRTGYEQQLAQASDYANAGTSGGVQYRLSETDSGSVNLGRSRFHTLDDATRSVTDDYSVGWSRTLSESRSVSFSVGGYRTLTTARRAVLACPLQIELCNAGLVPFIVLQESGQTRRTGLQFSASVRQKLDEVTELALGASRQQSPSGTGVVVASESASARLGRALASELNASLAYAELRSSFEGAADAPKSRLQSLSASFNKSFSPQLSASAGYRRDRSSRPGSASSAGGVAHANVVSATLRYEWQRIEVGR